MALEHYAQTNWPVSNCTGEIANALYYGPTPVAQAIAQCQELLKTKNLNRYGQANIGAFLGGLVAQVGEFDRARHFLTSAREIHVELGHRMATATFSGVILGDVELLEDDPLAAEATFRWIGSPVAARQAYSRLASRAGDLAEALYRQGRLDEAAEWAGLGERHSASDDLDAQVLWMPVRAKLAGQLGDGAGALKTALRAVELVDTSDGLNRRAAVWADLGEVHRLAGDTVEAAAAFARAVELYEAKGNVIGAARAASLLPKPARA